MRLRLDMADLKILKNTGSLLMSTAFPTGKLEWKIVVSPQAEEIEVKLSDQLVTINMPMETFRNWANTEQVGMETGIEVGNDDFLKVLIEKDFKCLTQRDENDDDAFPNPLEKHDC